MQNRLARLQVAEACGQVDIVYFDTAGFHLIPCVPDAWQPPGVTYELPSGGRQRLNVIGWLTRAKEASFYPHTGSIRRAQVIAALDHVASARPHHLT